uniref:Uncharacterized protein n=1 Tax=Cyprinus carpio carpio TaxID=630221 RepID=A0A9J8AZM3_CYPCA
MSHMHHITDLSGSKATVDLPDFDAPVTGMETSADVNMEEVDEDMIVEDADEYSAQPWMKPHNLLQDKLLRYILDTGRLAEEVIVKEGVICLLREDFWTLGLRREMESDGKDIYTADMYVVTTWKDSVAPLAYFPDDADMKDALVFPLWTKAAGPEHYLLCEYCTSS